MLQIQNIIKKFMKARSWDKLPPADLAKSISIESAELLEHFQWQNFSVEEIKKDKQKYQDIQDEIGDIMIYCLEMANRLDFDIEKATSEKLKKAEEKYPAKLFKNSKEPHGTGTYLKIKEVYRKAKNK